MRALLLPLAVRAGVASRSRPLADPGFAARSCFCTPQVFHSEGIEIIRTPFRAPKANAFAERWVGTVRRDCLDWLLISSRKQLECVLHIYVDHYNTHRPHRALGLAAPTPGPRLHPVGPAPPDHVHRRDRLGGLIHEYTRAA